MIPTELRTGQQFDASSTELPAQAFKDWTLNDIAAELQNGRQWIKGFTRQGDSVLFYLNPNLEHEALPVGMTKVGKTAGLSGEELKAYGTAADFGPILHLAQQPQYHN